MLWYSKVVPILLPAMLISFLIVKNVSGSKSRSSALVSTLLLGTLCGYPIGAKVASEYCSSNIYSKSTADLIIPLCNNSSPMFLAGYVATFVLNNNISFFKIIIIIYIPYVLYTLSGAIIYQVENRRNNMNETALKSHIIDTDSQYPLIENAINQITYIGVCIMICSVAIEFILKLPIFPLIFKYIAPSIIEITNGLFILNSCALIDTKIKTALIIALTSFGGICSILQTSKVLKQSGLSLIHYIIVKTICSITSYFLGLLII